MVNHNGEEYLEKSLGSAYAQKEKFEDMILIDNASSDRSIEIVREKFPGVKVIGLEKKLRAGNSKKRRLSGRIFRSDPVHGQRRNPDSRLPRPPRSGVK